MLSCAPATSGIRRGQRLPERPGPPASGRVRRLAADGATGMSSVPDDVVLGELPELVQDVRIDRWGCRSRSRRRSWVRTRARSSYRVSLEKASDAFKLIENPQGDIVRRRRSSRFLARRSGASGVKLGAVAEGPDHRVGHRRRGDSPGMSTVTARSSATPAPRRRAGEATR